MAPRRSLKEALSPTPEYCFGRKSLCDRLQDTPYGEGATFLFGGILTGKTTLLLKVQSNLLNEAKARLKTSEVVIPVYADLRLLPDTQSSSLFHSLLSNLQSACQKVLPGFSCSPRDGDKPPPDVRSFARSIDQIFTPTEVASFRVLFLLDNCERLRSLPPGLQANLVWLLWGDGEFRHRNKISMIMAGGQQMRTLLIDPTTVMATRAAQEYIFNLSADDVLEMVKHSGPAADAKLIAGAVCAATGGHAGLARTLLVELTHLEKASVLAAAVEKFAAEKEESFRRIKDGLSAEAASIQELLSAGSPVTGHQVETRLQSSGLDRFKRPLCLRELRFSGVAVGDNAQIRSAGNLYWKFYSEYASQPATAGPQPPNGPNYVFKMAGTTWSLAYNGKQGSTGDAVGLLRIQRLLRRPNDWVSVVALAQEQEIEFNQARDNERRALELADQPEDGQSEPKSRKPKAAKQVQVDDLIDEETQKEVVEEIRSLAAEIKELERSPNTADPLIKEKKANLAQLRKYLANSSRAGTQPRGRAKSRTFASHDEKARKAVGKSIKEAIEQIRNDGLPELANHLTDYIRYDRYEYAYLPGANPLAWQL